jgi:hypothetical protein
MPGVGILHKSLNWHPSSAYRASKPRDKMASGLENGQLGIVERVCWGRGTLEQGMVLGGEKLKSIEFLHIGPRLGNLNAVRGD